MISEGCIIKKCRIHHSVLGVRSRVLDGSTIDDSLIMGSDIYEPYVERKALTENGNVPIGIGFNTTIRRAIVDKNARIGSNVMIINKEGD